MLPTRICQGCDQRLKAASNAMRRHASEMSKAIHMARSVDVTEEQRQDVTTRLVETFNDAQAAWDTYREHLIEHELLQTPK
jgi:hypothetical protein